MNMYKPMKTPGYFKALQQREEYANQTLTRPLKRSLAKPRVPEEYDHEYVIINPDTDKPDQEESVLPVAEDDEV
jgi:hypothetical protein